MQVAPDKPFISSRYQIQAMLGQGGMGIVYAALDRLTNAQVALKLVRVPLNPHGSLPPSDTPSPMLMSLAKEFRTLAALRHPHIINVLDYGFSESGLPFFTMELLEAPQHIIAYAHSLSLKAKIRLIIDLLEGLAYLHRHGIVHRDLKPDNILISNGQLRLLDFGLASEANLVSDLSGTLAYIAPEVFNGTPFSPQSDLYGVGLIAYELLTGEFPYQTKNITKLIRSIQSETPPFEPLTRAASPAIAAVIGRLLNRSPEDRYVDGGAAIAALVEAAAIDSFREDPLIRESLLRAAPFVGRKTERTLLEAALQEAVAGKGSVYLIGGESGVGKSRLIEEIRTRALVKGMVTVVGQALEGDSSPFQLWREPMRTLALVAPMRDGELSILKDIAPDIDALQDKFVDAAEPLNGESYQRRMSATIADVVMRFSSPLVILLEDVHWVSESLYPLMQLAHVAADLPLVVIASFRSDEAPDLPERLSSAHLLILPRFSRAEIQQLSPAILGESGDRPHVIDFLERHTEGNPFFVVETLRTLAQYVGSLDDVGQKTLPETILSQGMLDIAARRLRRLPKLDQRVMIYAAIFGREIDGELLREIERDLDFDQWIAHGVNSALLALRGGQPRFSHDKMREGILKLVPDPAHFFRVAAEAVERVYAERDDYRKRLAVWWWRAGEIGRSLPYVALDTESLMRRGEFKQARDVLSNTLDMLPDGYPAARLKLSLLLGRALNVMTDFVRAESVFRQCLELAESLSDEEGRAQALIGLGNVLCRTTNPTAGVALIKQGIVWYGDRRDEDTATAWLMLGHAYYTLRDFENMIACAERTYMIATEINAENLMARCYHQFASAFILKPEYSQAELWALHAIDCYQNQNDRQGMMHAATVLSAVYASMKNFAQAKAWSELGIRFAESMGNLQVAAVSLGNLGYRAAQSGDNVEGEMYFLRAISQARMINARTTMANQLGALAQVQILLGKWEAAFASAYEWLTIAYQLNNLIGHLHGLYAAVDLALYVGQPITAARWLGLLIANAKPMHQDPDEQAKLRGKIAAVLGDDRTDALIAEGKTMPFESTMADIYAFLSLHTEQNRS